MADLPLNETGSVLADWAEDVLDYAAGFAQAALDMTALALVAGLFWLNVPEKSPVPPLPGPVATAVCHADCIEVMVLASGS